MNFILLLILLLSIIVKSNQQDLFKISTIHELIQNKTYTCRQIIKLFVDRAEKYQNLNAIISYNPLALIDAVQLDSYYARYKFKGKLHCIPVIVKDNIDVKDLPTTAGLNAFSYWKAKDDALVIKRLRKNGAIFLAKSNMAELASFLKPGFKEGSSEKGGECQNPFSSNISCGASSSGSAVAVAAGLTVIAIGTDTFNSIIYPSSLLGIYGLRTQFDMPKMDGIMPAFRQQDTVGPMTKYINDLVLSYSVMVDNETIYNEFIRTDNEKPVDLRITVLNLFFKSFNYGSFHSYNNGKNTADLNQYKINSEYSKLLKKAIYLFESIKINVFRFCFNLEELKKKESIFLPIWELSTEFMNYCLEKQLNDYLLKTRFKNFSYYYPKFPNNVQKFFDYHRFNSIGNCSQMYLHYDEMRKDFIELIDSLFLKYNADVLVLPNRPDFRQPNDISNQVPHFDFLHAFGNKLAFNLPIGYLEPNQNEPDGFPAGLIVVARSDRIVQAFKIAKLYEKAHKTDFAKLPSNTPFFKTEKRIIKKICINPDKSKCSNSTFVEFT